MTNQYPVPTEDCRILWAVHNSKSVREAAKLLGCDHSGLLRKISRISEEHKIIHKIEGKWILSEMGVQLINWMNQSIKSQKHILNINKSLKISSYGWLLDEILIDNIKDLKKSISNLENIYLSVQTDNETELKTSNIDFVISCRPPESPDIIYNRITSEEWIIIIPKSWEDQFKNKSKTEVFSILSGKPYIKHIDLNQNKEFENNISFKIDYKFNRLGHIKTAVKNELGWAYVPLLSVKSTFSRNCISILDIDLPITNYLCLWRLRSRKDLIDVHETVLKWLNGTLCT